MATITDVPVLQGDALAAVKHRGSHLQIIASAGSGKTEVVAQRVADLIAEKKLADPPPKSTMTQQEAREMVARLKKKWREDDEEDDEETR
jgi:DNA helicase-2/ATP-dependent DNA helicase PcrA